MKKKIVTPTPFGPVAIIWSGSGSSAMIVRVLLSKPGLSGEDAALMHYPDSQPASCTEIDAIAAGITAFLEGDDIAFPLDLVDLDACPTFQKKVLIVEHRIPRGSVSTYQRIAQHLGNRNGARAVGNALAGNPFPLIVPCHRAIRSDGHPGGFQGGSDMKRRLLEIEGIAFDDAGRVSGARFHYNR